MSIFKSRVLTFILALFCVIPFTLAFAGCDTNTDKSKEQATNTYNTVVESLNQMSDNFSVTAKGSFVFSVDSALSSLSSTDSETLSQISSHSGNVELKFRVADSDAYYCVTTSMDAEDATVVERYLKNGAIYTVNDNGSYMKLSSYDDFDNHNTYFPTNLKDYDYSYANTIKSANWSVVNGFQNFVEVANLLSDDVLSTSTEDGITTLTATLDFASVANKIKANIASNYNEKITVFIDQLLQDIYGDPNKTFDSILKGFTDNYNKDTTTRLDLLKYIDQVTGLSFSNVYESLLTLSNVDEDDDIDLSVLLDKDLTASGETWYDGTGESIYNYVTAELNGETIATIVKSMAGDAAKQDSFEIDRSVDLGLALNMVDSTTNQDTTMKLCSLSADFSATFSDIGETTIDAPTNIAITDISLYVYPNNIEADDEKIDGIEVKDGYIVISLDDYSTFGINYNMSDTFNDTTIDAIKYSSEAKELRINLEWAKAKISESQYFTIISFGSDNQYSIRLYMYPSKTSTDDTTDSSESTTNE